MRTLPCMTVVAPGTAHETRHAVRAMVLYPGPHYLRLAKAVDIVPSDTETGFQLGRARLLRHGEDLTLIATGGMLPVALNVAHALQKEGVSAQVLSMHTLTPLDTAAVLDAARRTKAVVTLEEHSISGGLGGAVAEVLCEAGIADLRFKRLGLPAEFCCVCGNQSHLLAHTGLTEEGILETIRAFLRRP